VNHPGRKSPGASDQASDPAPVRGVASGPWNRERTLYFYAGLLSNFSGFRGLSLPGAWYGHPQVPQRYEIPTGEHWLHAAKTTNKADFEWVLSASSPRQAKRRGSATGERQAGGFVRRIELRPDWDAPHPRAPRGMPTKLLVAAFYWRARARVDETYRKALMSTGDVDLVEDSPTDFEWGGRDARGGFAGRNLLGIAHMQVRTDWAASLDPSRWRATTLTTSARPLSGLPSAASPAA
jgi:predicted NAD-dependent protein-ADP-ribosyltransferase YbiA (DUF1768 family)